MVAFSITLLACLLSRSGDVETNPGPPEFDLIPDNIKKVQDEVWGARAEWHELGLQLNIGVTELKVINIEHGDVKSRFREMLLTWLKMIDPPPSWEIMVTALEHDSVKHGVLAESIRKKFGIPKHPMDASTDSTSNVSSASLDAVRRDTDKLEDQFGEIAERTLNVIRDNKVTAGVIICHLTNLRVRYKQQHKEFLEKLLAENISDTAVDATWAKLNVYSNFLNYSLLEHLVHKFGNEELGTSMKDYNKLLKDFRLKTRLCDFAKYFEDVNENFADTSDFRNLETKLNKKWEECTLEDLENWRENITQNLLLPSFVMKLRAIGPGCVSVTWAIPAMFAASLLETIPLDTHWKEFCEEQEIVSLKIDGKEYTYPSRPGSAGHEEEPHTSPLKVALSSADLPEVQTALRDVILKWYNLGVELGLKQETLKSIKANYPSKELCFTEMLSAWLLSAPHPSWEGLLAALEHPGVGDSELAEDLRLKLETHKQLIGSNIQKLKEQFHALESCTFDRIREKQVTVSVFREFLTGLFLEEELVHREFLDKLDTEMRRASAVEDIWDGVCVYWNYFNPSLLGHVITKFGDEELRTDMEDYKKTLKSFRCKTHVHDFLDSYEQKFSEENWKELSFELHQNWDEGRLDDLENLAERVSHEFHLPPFLMVLQVVTNPDCLHVTWAVPAMIGASLKENMGNMGNTDMREFCKGNGVTAITIDGEECKYSPAKIYSAYLKDLYSRKEGKNLAPFKLARIVKKQVVDRRKCDDFTRSTLRGDQDDVVYTKEHIDEDKIGVPTYWTEYKQPRLLLIEGAPGVGKTTFSEQFCYKWSQAKLLSNHRLLVLLPLRDKRVRSARNVSDLFQHPQLQQAIAEEVESSGGEGVALWLEAWDELGEEMRNKSSIFLDLVHGRVLPKATVIITSRPWATKNLREITSIKLDQHVEIVSTPKIQFSRILREDRVKPDSRAKFIDYVNFNPSIKAAIHTPVTADIVAEVFQWSRDTESTPPTTMTQLYTAFTCKLLMQHLSSRKEEGSKSGKIRSLEDVPADVKGRLLEMCRLAWEGILEQQLTFSSDVVGGDTLGLMHGVRELYGGEDSQLSYHFIHLTLQEFLSAYHITQLPLDKQEQVIQEHIRTGHLNGVVRFYFGLTKPNDFTRRMITRRMITRRMIGEHLSDGATAYHWLFEAGGVETGLRSARAVTVVPSYSWSPLDWYVLGYSVASCQFQWELACGNTSMGDEGVEMLCKGMVSTAETAWAGKIECDFGGNMISQEGIKLLVNIPLQLAQQITKLDFWSNRLDGNALNAFCEGVPKLTKLQLLSLSDNPIGRGGAVAVLKCLHHCKTPLKELNLADTGVGEEDCAQLALLIGDTDTLETLHIPGETLSSNSVVEGLLQNSTIQQLHMADSPLSEENCVSLASLLQRAECQWNRLDITACGISGVRAAHLATALTNNHSLMELTMTCNPIGDIGAAAVGDMLRYNTALTLLHVDGCGITSEGCVELAAGLTENTALQTLRMSGNRVGVKGAKALSEVMGGNQTLRLLWLHHDDSLGEEEGVDWLIASLQENTTLEVLHLSEQYRRPADPRVEWW